MSIRNQIASVAGRITAFGLVLSVLTLSIPVFVGLVLITFAVWATEDRTWWAVIAGMVWGLTES